MDKKSKTIADQNIKQKIAIEVARQQSFLIGCFHKPLVKGLVINQWAVASVSNPIFLRLIGEEMTKIINNDIDKVDILCGIETAGIGIAAVTSLVSGIPWIYAR